MRTSELGAGGAPSRWATGSWAPGRSVALSMLNPVVDELEHLERFAAEVAPRL